MSHLPAGVMREALIDTTAITENVRHLRRLTDSDVIAVVKADGYGHGALRSAVAALAGGASRLGVADVAEAIALRRAGIDAPILAWLHAPVVFAEAARLERIGKLRVVGIFSHLSNTSPADDRAALDRFTESLALASSLGLTPPLRHLAASHAAIDLPEARFGCVRLGIAMYGLSPFADRTSADLGLRPAMSLRAAVAAVRRVPAGQGVSYGYTHRTEGETTLALVPLGYADGVPRAASGGGAVRIGGGTFPVAGRIAMDQFVVDVGDHPVAVGDEAMLFGDPTLGAPAVEEWADSAGTINYEIVTRIGPRAVRREVAR